jgi:hypothetical protein
MRLRSVRVSRKSRFRNEALWVFALLAVLAALGARYEMASASGLSHDETISVITAQGNITPTRTTKRPGTTRCSGNREPNASRARSYTPSAH